MNTFFKYTVTMDKTPTQQTTTYRFCPRCATPYTPEQAKKVHKTCQDCDFVVHESLILATGAIITDAKERVLLVRRAIEPQKGLWDLPGGFCEPHEHPEQTILREVREELGVPAKINSLFGLFGPNEYLYLGKINYTLDAFYLVELLDMQIQAQDDIADFEWFEKDALPSGDELAFAATKAVVSQISHNNE